MELKGAPHMTTHDMNVSYPNEHGVLEPGHRAVVASRGRAYAAVNIALREDGRFAYGLEMSYSHGGFMLPICVDRESFSTEEAARTAALDELLRRWHKPFPSEPASVHDELRDLREQVESRLRQPSLF
jgi:hypothetical protein